jgi:hypothetical protein
MGIAVRLRWHVEDLAVVMASYDQIMVKRSIVGVGGPYTEITSESTRIDLQAGITLYEYIDADGEEAYWYRITWHDSNLINPDDDQDPFQGEASNGMYCQVEDLRDEGITEAMLSDVRAINKIKEWSRYIENVTRRFFEPRSKTIPIDGRDIPVLRTGDPIIMLSSAKYWSGRGSNFDDSQEIEIADVRVYNRHLTADLENPDDRADPRIEFPVSSIYPYLSIWDNTSESSTRLASSQFPESRLGIAVTGIFGYTELDPDDSVGETSPGSQIPLAYGRTPPAIRKACMLLVLRDSPQLVELSDREDYSARWTLTQEKTADQSYTRASPAALGQVGYWTGDPQIDGLLAMYVSGGGGRVSVP